MDASSFNNGMMPEQDMSTEYPSSDPSMVGSILQLIAGMREQDHSQLQAEQDQVLMEMLSSMGMLPSPMEGMAEGADENAAPVVAPEGYGSAQAMLPGQSQAPGAADILGMLNAG